MIKRIFLLLIFIPFLGWGQSERPKIGLTLSGGGAKGLAHIGVLKAIDSVGINIDYITGTSMGAIVGGLYAVGHTAKEIEKIGRSIDWDRVLSNNPAYSQLIFPHKLENRKFVEIPMIGKKLYFGKGVLESNELWLLLSRFFFSYNKNNVNFGELPIPFHCVATHLETGDAVILSKGNLVKAIRASMAIPSVFTPVEIDGETLIDGGLVMNFPVTEVRNMGAEIVIGSSVTGEEVKSEGMMNPFQVLSQIAFYGEQRNYAEQINATDIFINYPIGDYYAGSFSSADDIIDLGLKRGLELVPVLQSLKDSLDQIYGEMPVKTKEINTLNYVKVAGFIPEGLNASEYGFFMRQLNLSGNRSYTPAAIADRIRKAYASRAFLNINYELEENSDSSYNVHLNFRRNHSMFLRTGLDYNTENGLGIKMGLAKYSPNNLFSTQSVTVSIGENPQLNANLIRFIDQRKSLYFNTSLLAGINNLGLYNKDLAKIGVFNQQTLSIEADLNKLINEDFQIGIGTRWESLRKSPEIESMANLKGKTNFFNTHFVIRFNSRDAAFAPRKGNSANLEFGINHNQSIHILSKDSLVLASLPVDKKLLSRPYPTLKFNSSHYFPLKKDVIFMKFGAGIHLGNRYPVFNDFIVGTNKYVFRNQVLFPGIRLNEVSTSSALTTLLGYRHYFNKNFTLSGSAGTLWYGFIAEKLYSENPKSDRVIGFDLSLAYNTAIGPVEISLMHNSINRKLIPSFNIGYALNFSK